MKLPRITYNQNKAFFASEMNGYDKHNKKSRV